MGTVAIRILGSGGRRTEQMFVQQGHTWLEVPYAPNTQPDEFVEFSVEEAAQIAVLTSPKNALEENLLDIRGDESYFIRYSRELIALLESGHIRWVLSDPRD